MRGGSVLSSFILVTNSFLPFHYNLVPLPTEAFQNLYYLTHVQLIKTKASYSKVSAESWISEAVPLFYNKHVFVCLLDD